MAYPTGPPSGRAPARPVPKPLAGQMLVLQMGCKEKKRAGGGRRVRDLEAGPQGYSTDGETAEEGRVEAPSRRAGTA